MYVECEQRRRMAVLLLLLWFAAVTPVLQAQKSVREQRRQLEKEEQKYADLQEHLPRQQGMKRAQTLAELARLDFDFANVEYQAGRADKGERYLQQARVFAAQAMQVVKEEAAAGHRGGMKKIEMAFQEVSFGLHDLAYLVDFTQRPPVEQARQFFSNQRAEILSLMFAPKVKK